MRDFQRGRVYQAEYAAGNGREMPELEECRQYVFRILASRWTKKNFPHCWNHKPVIKDGRGTRVARGTFGWMNLPRWARNERVVLHELAHVLNTDPWVDGAHGRTYARIFLQVVRRWMGAESGARMMDAYRKNKVRWHPKRGRKKVISNRTFRKPFQV